MGFGHFNSQTKLISVGNFTFNFDFFLGGGNLHLSLTIIFCVIHIDMDMDMGGAAEIFQSQEIIKTKTKKHRYKFYQIKYFTIIFL